MPRSDTKGSKRLYAMTCLKKPDPQKPGAIHIISSFNMNKALCGHSTHHAKWNSTGYYPADSAKFVGPICKLCLDQMKRMENLA